MSCFVSTCSSKYGYFSDNCFFLEFVADLPPPDLLCLFGIYFSQITTPFKTVIESPSFNLEISVKDSSDFIGKNKPSDCSPLNLIAVTFRFTGSMNPPMLFPCSSFFLSKLFASANSLPSFPPDGKYTPKSPS